MVSQEEGRASPCSSGEGRGALMGEAVRLQDRARASVAARSKRGAGPRMGSEEGESASTPLMFMALDFVPRAVTAKPRKRASREGA